MKSVWFVASFVAMTASGLECDYSGTDHVAVDLIRGGYRLSGDVKMQRLVYIRNATETYDTEFGYGYDSWALARAYLAYSLSVDIGNGKKGLGVFIKENWRDKIKQFQDRGVEMPPGIAVALEGQKGKPKNKKINDMDVLRLDFGGLIMHDLTFTLADLSGDEKASYRTYHEGVKQAEGTIMGTGDGTTDTELHVFSASGFDTIEFFVGGTGDDASDYVLTFVEYCAPKSCDKKSMDVAMQYGDPHIQSFDKLKWDCQGTGTFQTFLGETTDPESGMKETVMEIQSVFVKLGGRQMAVTGAVTISSFEEDVPDITIAAKMDEETGQCKFRTFDSIQNKLVDYRDARPFGTDAVFLKVREARQGRNYQLEFSYLSTHTEVEITVVGKDCYLGVAVCLGSGYWDDPNNSVTGILGGKADGDQENDWMTKGGQFQQIPPLGTTKEEKTLRSETQFNFCVDNWCIGNEMDSKVAYSQLGQTFDQFNECAEEFSGAQSCEDVADDPEFENEVAVCKAFLEDYRTCVDPEEPSSPSDEVLLDECYAEGCAGGTNAIVDWVKTLCEITKTLLGEGVIEDIWEAGGSKDSPAPTDSPTRNQVARGELPTLAPAGGVSGDPHFKTWSGKKYDYHGICDLVLISHLDFHGGLGLSIHVRSKKTKQWSYISTAAVRIGTETFEVAGIKDGNTHWLNTLEVGDEEWDAKAVEIVGFPIKYTQMHSKQREYVIDLGDDESIQLKTWKDMVRVDVVVNHEKDTFDGSSGLMGSYPKGTTLGRDGKTTILDLNQFGQEWQVLSSESKLFRLDDGPQHPTKCEAPGKTAMRRRLAQSDISRKEAEIACSRASVSGGEFDLCVFDVMAIGDKSVAGAY